MSTTTINISMPDTMKVDIEEIVASEGYGNTSEFFRDLVRTYLKDRQGIRLEALLLEGLNSGESTPFTKDDLESIKQRGIERIMRAKRK